MGTECWAYCQSGFLGAPRRYECVLNSTGQLEPLGRFKSWLPLAAFGCLLRLQAEEPVVCSPQRRLLSCEVDVRLFDTRFLHSCAAADEGDVCLVHCSPGYSMASQPTLLSCQNGQLTGGHCLEKCDSKVVANVKSQRISRHFMRCHPKMLEARFQAVALAHAASPSLRVLGCGTTATARIQGRTARRGVRRCNREGFRFT